MLLTHFSPVSHFYTPWKPLVFWRFQGVQKYDTGLKWVKYAYDLWLACAKMLVNPLNIFVYLIMESSID